MERGVRKIKVQIIGWDAPYSQCTNFVLILFLAVINEIIYYIIYYIYYNRRQPTGGFYTRLPRAVKYTNTYTQYIK